MPLSSSLNVGVSALKSFAEGIQVTSNNISNVNTVGYKASRAQYSDSFSNLLRPLVPNVSNTGVKIPPTQIGGGVQIESVSAIFSQGTIQTSANNSDLAIAGSGFFLVKDVTTGKVMATRAGNFRLDSDGYLVTQQGYRVQGAGGATTRVEYDSLTKSIDVKGVQDNHAAVVRALNQESYDVYVPSLDNISVDMVVTGSGVPYGTRVKSVDTVIGSNGYRVTLSKKPSITTGEPSATQTFLSLIGASVYASMGTSGSTTSAITDFSEGMYVAGDGIAPGAVITAVNKSSLADGAYPPVATPFSAVVTSTVASVDTNRALVTADATADLSTVKAGMAFKSGSFTATIVSVDNATKKITLSQPAPAAVTATSPFTIEIGGGTGQSVITMKASDAQELRVGMMLKKQAGYTWLGDGGVYITNVDVSTGKVTISQPLTGDLNSSQLSFVPTVTMSKAAVETNSAADTWKLSTPFPELRFSNYYTPALNVGDVKISFDEGLDFIVVDRQNTALSGLARAEALDNAPRIRTFNVGTDGSISVILSNGQTFSAGYVLLQSFKDPGALIREGSNMFSGIDTAGKFNGDFTEENIGNLIPGTRGLGAINGGGLELSNVDLGEEFSNMIVTQRAFQAGSRVISTTDAMMEEVVNLKR
jgi:flagellar hook protein FlgE